MNVTLSVVEGANPQMVINRCGYATHHDRHATQLSFTRRLGSYSYPRFHLYVNSINENGIHCSLHLDMKQPTYVQGHAHSGEYSGPQVEKEVERIRLTILQSYTST